MTELMWLLIGLLVGGVGGAITGVWYGHRATLDEIEAQWWKHQREQRTKGLS